MLTQASPHYSQFRAGWGPCPGYRIVLAKDLGELSRLKITGGSFSMGENTEEKWLQTHHWWEGKVENESLWNHMMWLEVKVNQAVVSHMSLTCRGRPGEFYPLLYEPQPWNSCWQSCLSASRPLTWWTNTKMWNIWKTSACQAFQQRQQTNTDWFWGSEVV